MTRHSHLAFSLLVATLAPLGHTQDASWPQFRGAGGMATASDQQIPEGFGPDKHVLFKVEVPRGHSSPCIHGKHLFLTGAKGKELFVFCFDRITGETVWKKTIPMKRKENFMHKDSDPAAPTPCTDGERVYAFFGAFGLVALDMKGEIVWKKTFPVLDNMFGTGSSPLIDGDRLYLVRDNSALSAAHCFDAKTGEEKWRTPRREARVNYATPFIWKYGEREELVVPGSSILKAYSLKDGEPTWWVNNVCVFSCPSPVASNDMLYYGAWATPNEPAKSRLSSAFDPEETGLSLEVLNDLDKLFEALDKDKNGTLELAELPRSRAKDTFDYLDFNKNGSWEKKEAGGLLKMPKAPGRNVLVAIRPGGEGDVTKTHVEWEKRRGLPYVASPLLYKGKLYFVKKGGLISCIDAKSGKGHYERKRLGVTGEYYATPVGVGNRILVTAARGTVFVLGTGEKLEVIAKTDLGEGLFATPAIVENTLYLRGTKHLWAFSSKAAPGQPGK